MIFWSARTTLDSPLLAEADDPRARIIELLEQRESGAYRSAAHAIVETSGMPREEAVERVSEHLSRTPLR